MEKSTQAPVSHSKMAYTDDRPVSPTDSESSVHSRGSDAPFLGQTPHAKSYETPTSYPLVNRTVNMIESTDWWSVARQVGLFLVPSFLQGAQAREKIRPAHLSPTAYFDGMRGLAALFVYFCHYSYQVFTIAEGWGCGTTNFHILKLPFLRLWYQGPAAVCVFFVISGYALSYRPLKLIRSRSTAELSKTMSSLTFRRGIRLFIPPAVSSLMVAVLLQLGVFELTRDFATNPAYHPNIIEPHAVPLPTMGEQLRDWAWTMVAFVRLFDWDKYSGKIHYDVHLWTIPVEFRCSLYLFLVLLATAQLRTHMRFITVGFVSYITYRYCRWDLLLFFAGMILAELDHMRGAHTKFLSLPTQEKAASPARGPSTLCWILLSLIGLFLLGMPDGRAEITPGWIYLSSLIPDWWVEERFRYWQSIGAVIFIFAVGHVDAWKRFFNTGVVQYFGKISYAIYLMHGPVMHVVGYQWEAWAYGITGTEGNWLTAGFFLAAFFAVPSVVWAADIFWRAVDIPVVKFAKWYEGKCVIGGC